MADNVPANSGDALGPTFATDDIGGVHYPITKITVGALDAQTLLSGGNGATDSGTVRVTIASDTTGVLSVDDGGSSLTVDATALDIRALTNADVITAEVSSVIPGVAATSLGKAVNDPAGATDTGVAVLAKHVEDNVHLVTATGDYDLLQVDSRGALTSNIEQHHTFDELDATTGWSVLNDDAANLSTTTIHAIGTNALTFDKVNGTANTVFAAIQKTVSSIDLGAVSPHDLIQTMVYISDLTNVDYVFVRMGANGANYSEWRIPGANLTADQFETLAFTVGDTSHAGSTGTGWDSTAITYLCLGVAFNAETDTLTGIIFDQLSYHTNTHTSTSIQSEVTSSVSSANVNVQKVGNQVVNTQSGNVANGTQRVTIATDDANLSAINTTATTIETNTDFGTVLGGGAEVSALRVTIANDSTGVISIDDGGGSVTVDAVSLPLPTGAATETTLATVETNTDFGTVIGGGTEATALRVTIASDTTGVLSIDDGGSSITIDAVSLPLPSGAATEATLATIDTDTGNIAAGYAAEGAALGSGVLIQGDDGTDRTNVLVDTDGHLQVDVLSGGGSGPTDTDDDAVAAGQSPALNIAMAYLYDGTDWSRAASGTGVRTLQTQRVTIATDDTVTVAATDLDIRALVNTDVVTAELSATDNAVLDTIASAVHIEDQASVDTHAGTFVLAVRRDTAASGVSADGDYASINVDSTGHLHSRDITAVGHDNGAVDWVSMIGLEARSTIDPALATQGNAVYGTATLLGKQVNHPYSTPDLSWQYASATGGVTDTADDVAKAAVAATRNYVTGIQVINGHATVATEVVVKDGSTVIWRGWAEAAGGGVSAKVFLRGSINTAINVANITTGSKTYFNLQGHTATE